MIAAFFNYHKTGKPLEVVHTENVVIKNGFVFVNGIPTRKANLWDNTGKVIRNNYPNLVLPQEKGSKVA